MSINNLLKSLMYGFISIILSTLLITILSYFNIFSDNITKILKLTFPLISVFIAGFIGGKYTHKKIILEGLKIGLVIDILFIIISIMTGSFKGVSIIYYIIILVSTIFGSLVGFKGLKDSN